MKTGKQIERDVYTLLVWSELAKELSGNVYYRGQRPRDSRKEDAVVMFTGGIPEQVHEGIVTIDIYVPDIDPYDNGTYVENATRLAEVETATAKWVEDINAIQSLYEFSLQSTIYTAEEAETNQHFVVVKLRYKLIEL